MGEGRDLMRVTVAICTWNRAPLLRQTLAQLQRLDVPADVTWDLVIVNNNSTDETAEVVREFMKRLPIKYIVEPTAGLSVARNTALRIAEGEIVLFTDDDVLVAPGWLAACVAGYMRFPSAGVFGGPIRAWFPVEPDPLLAAAFPILARGFCGHDHGRPLGPLPDDQTVVGANMAFRAAAIQGLAFDPRHGPKGDQRDSGEELDFVELVRARGHAVIWIPEMHLQHYVDPARMSLAYLRNLTEGHGAYLARRPGALDTSLMLGAPRWAWRTAATQLARYVLLNARGRRGEALVALREYLLSKGFIKEARATRGAHAVSAQA
jgi:glucosyl-dolichyl phosphate glucuronosyltransferase